MHNPARCQPPYNIREYVLPDRGGRNDKVNPDAGPTASQSLQRGLECVISDEGSKLSHDNHYEWQLIRHCNTAVCGQLWRWLSHPSIEAPDVARARLGEKTDSLLDLVPQPAE